MPANSRIAPILIILMALALFSCAAMRRDAAIDKERILAAAGFQMKLADTSDKRARLTAFSPQRKLAAQTIDGQLRFVYADAEYCKCVYVGTEQAHQRFQKLALEKRISDQQVQAADANEAAAMQWGAWGGWGPWY